MIKEFKNMDWSFEGSEKVYYKATRSGTARGRSGAERDRGNVVHLVTDNDYPSWNKAVCGVEPRGNGWYYREDPKVKPTCEKCISRIESESIIK